MKRFRVHADLCCGLKLCMKAAPGLFRVDAMGYNASDGQPVRPDQVEAAERGAEACPEQAIELVDAGDAD